MKWFRDSVLGLSIGCLSAAAYAQEANVRPLAPPPITLGKSVPLVADSAVRPAGYVADPAPIVNAFVPIRQPASPRVVRGARAVLDDEPGDVFLPKDLAPGPARKVPAQTVPAQTVPAQPPRPAAMPIKDGFNFFRVDKKVTIDVLAEEPETILPRVVDSRSAPIQRVRHSDEHIIMVDDHGNPLFGAPGHPGKSWYGQMDWLLWWTKGFHQPPLVTTSFTTDGGEIGAANTRLLYGDNNSSIGPRTGGRFTLGRTLDDCGIWSLEATYFNLAAKNDSFIASSADFPVLARPFFNVNLGQQDRELTATPDLPISGTVQVASSSRLWGFEANARALLWCGCQYNVSGLVGFRYLDLYEDLSITERIRINGSIPELPQFRPGDRATVQDIFATRNRFYGGQIGLNHEYRHDRWTLDTRMKIAFGVTHQLVDIDGKQRIESLNGNVQNFNGGLYALSSNIGKRSQNHFGVVPEVGIKLGYNLTDNIRLYAGYDFLYWTNVVRPGDQIDQALDANKIPSSSPAGFPPASQVRPVVPFNATGFWAQGVSVGMEIRY